VKARKNRILRSLFTLFVVVSLMLSVSVGAFTEEASSVVGAWEGTGTMDDIKVGIRVTFTDKQFTVESNHYSLQGDYSIDGDTVTLSALGFSIPLELKSGDARTLTGSIKFEDYEADMSLTELLDSATDAPTATDSTKMTGDLNDLLGWLSTIK